MLEGVKDIYDKPYFDSDGNPSDPTAWQLERYGQNDVRSELEKPRPGVSAEAKGSSETTLSETTPSVTERERNEVLGENLSQEVGFDKSLTTKGSIKIFDNGEALIELFRSADRSTFLHEVGHFFLDDLRMLTKMEGVSGTTLSEWNETLQWLGVADIDFDNMTESDVKRWKDAQEKFAAAFNKYQMEGKAPTSTLQSLFDKFKEWLTAVFESVENITYTDSEGNEVAFEINDDIRGVFDSMLNAEAGIEHEGGSFVSDTIDENTESNQNAKADGTERNSPSGGIIKEESEQIWYQSGSSGKKEIVLTLDTFSFIPDKYPKSREWAFAAFSRVPSIVKPIVKKYSPQIKYQEISNPNKRSGYDRMTRTIKMNNLLIKGNEKERFKNSFIHEFWHWVYDNVFVKNKNLSLAFNEAVAMDQEAAVETLKSIFSSNEPGDVALKMNWFFAEHIGPLVEIALNGDKNKVKHPLIENLHDAWESRYFDKAGIVARNEAFAELFAIITESDIPPSVMARKLFPNAWGVIHNFLMDEYNKQ